MTKETQIQANFIENCLLEANLSQHIPIMVSEFKEKGVTYIHRSVPNILQLMDDINEHLLLASYYDKSSQMVIIKKITLAD